MADEQTSEPDPGKRPVAEPSPPPEVPIADAPSDQNNTTDSTDQTANSTIEKTAERVARRELRAPEWIMAIFTIAIFFTGVSQCSEMHSGGIDTHYLAAAASEQASSLESEASTAASQELIAESNAEAAASQAASMKDLATEASGQLAQMQASVAAAQVAGEAAKKSAAALKGQVDLMEAQQRPWIRIDPEPIEINGNGLHWENNYGQMIFNLPMINVGHSPAFSAQARIYPYYQFKGAAQFEQVKCNNLRENNLTQSGQGATIFPGEQNSNSNGYDVQWDVRFDAEDVKKNSSIDSAGIRNIALFVVGCADYTFASGSTHHQTGFLYRLARHNREGRNDTGINYSFVVGMDIPAKDIVLVKTPDGSINTD